MKFIDHRGIDIPRECIFVDTLKVKQHLNLSTYRFDKLVRDEALPNPIRIRHSLSVWCLCDLQTFLQSNG